MFKINQHTVNLIIITVLVSAIIILAGQCYIFYKDLQIQKDINLIYQHNEKVIAFAKLFIQKVIKSEEDVSFEDRLKLENAVRAINIQEIFDQWQEFTEAKTAAKAQEEVKNLLELLISRIAH